MAISRSVNLAAFLSFRGASAAVTGIDKVSRSLGGFLGLSARTNRSMAGLATGIRDLSIIGVAGGAMFGALAKGVVDLEKNLSVTAAVSHRVAGDFEENFSILANAAKSAGAQTVFTSAEASHALQTLALSGMDARQSAYNLRDALDLATVGEIGTGEAGRMLTSIIQGMGYSLNGVITKTGQVIKSQEEYNAAIKAGEEPIKTSRFILDKLVAIQSRTNVTVAETGQAMKFMTSALRTGNISLDEGLTIVGLLGNANIRAGMAGRNYRSMLLQLSNTFKKEGTPEMAAFAEELKASNKEQINTMDIIEALNRLVEKQPDALSKLNTIMTSTGLRGSAAYQALSSGAGKYKEVLDAVKNSSLGVGAANRQVEAMVDTVWGSIKMLTSVLQSINEEFLLPMRTSAKNTIMSVVGVFRKLSLAMRVFNADEKSRKEFAEEDVKAWEKSGKGMRQVSMAILKAQKIISNSFDAIKKKILEWGEAFDKAGISKQTEDFITWGILAGGLVAALSPVTVILAILIHSFKTVGSVAVNAFGLMAGSISDATRAMWKLVKVQTMTQFGNVKAAPSTFIGKKTIAFGVAAGEVAGNIATSIIGKFGASFSTLTRIVTSFMSLGGGLTSTLLRITVLFLGLVKIIIVVVGGVMILLTAFSLVRKEGESLTTTLHRLLTGIGQGWNEFKKGFIKYFNTKELSKQFRILANTITFIGKVFNKIFGLEIDSSLKDSSNNFYTFGEIVGKFLSKTLIFLIKIPTEIAIAFGKSTLMIEKIFMNIDSLISHTKYFYSTMKAGIYDTLLSVATSIELFMKDNPWLSYFGLDTGGISSLKYTLQSLKAEAEVESNSRKTELLQLEKHNDEIRKKMDEQEKNLEKLRTTEEEIREEKNNYTAKIESNTTMNFDSETVAKSTARRQVSAALAKGSIDICFDQQLQTLAK